MEIYKCLSEPYTAPEAIVRDDISGLVRDETTRIISQYYGKNYPELFAIYWFEDGAKKYVELSGELEQSMGAQIAPKYWHRFGNVSACDFLGIPNMVLQFSCGNLKE